MAVITISRETFSGGQQLAECVAEKLGYRCISGEAVLLKAASEYGISEEELSRALSRKPGILERLTSERDRYLACIKAALYKEAKIDNLVYYGHAGHLFLEEVPYLLRIRTRASIEFRTEAFMERNKFLNREDALHFIKQLDNESIKRVKFLYHTDWGNPALFDIVINRDSNTLDTACDIVCYAARLDQFKVNTLSRKTVEDLAFSNHVMAVLSTDRTIVTNGIKIKSDSGVVTIEGIAKFMDDADKIEKAVSIVPGVDKVINKIQKATSWADSEALRLT